MTITPTAFPEVLSIKPQKLGDERGWFMESFKKNLLEKAVGRAIHFCQENQAQSSYGVIRGLHYQMPPYAQSKLVSVLQGKVLDIAIDIRQGSPNFGKHLAIELAIASAWPRSSAPFPGYAPGVSINVITGRLNLLAKSINLTAFL